MKEYSKGIYVKFKPEEVEILHDRKRTISSTLTNICRSHG